MDMEKIDIEEASHRSELVCNDDIEKVATMTKDELYKYSHSRLGIKLDLSRRIKLLRIEVITAIKHKLNIPQDTPDKEKEPVNGNVKTVKPEFVFEPIRRRIFEYTEALGKRTDLIPCWPIDKDGKHL